MIVALDGQREEPKDGSWRTNDAFNVLRTVIILLDCRTKFITVASRRQIARGRFMADDTTGLRIGYCYVPNDKASRERTADVHARVITAKQQV